MNRQKLSKYQSWRTQPEFFELIIAALFNFDPMGICFPENPQRETEYAPEADEIAQNSKAASSVEELRQIIFQVFVRHFDESSRNIYKYDLIVNEIWRFIQTLHETERAIESPHG